MKSVNKTVNKPTQKMLFTKIFNFIIFIAFLVVVMKFFGKNTIILSIYPCKLIP